MTPDLVVPCALCGGTDYSQPRPPFRHAGWTEVRGQRFHFDCEHKAAEQGWFRRLHRTMKPETPRVTSRAEKHHPHAA